jgi:hypothetical protein
MASIVYVLCALTSVTCMLLLLRAFKQTRIALLFWSGIAFLVFAATNVLLFVDLVLVPQFDLLLARTVITLVGVVLLLYGLIRTNT